MRPAIRHRMTDKERGRGKTLVILGYPLGAIAHFLFFAVFLHLGETEMAAYNAVITGLWLLGTLLVHRNPSRYLIPTGVVLVLMEIPIHAVLASLLYGHQTGFVFYLFTAATTIALIPLASRPARVAIASGMVLLALWLVFYTSVAAPPRALPEAWATSLYLFNMAGMFLIAGGCMFVFEWTIATTEEQLAEEHRRAESLLLNILPAPIADQLKRKVGLIARDYPEASVLFADIVGFTEASARIDPQQLVADLNRVISRFDALADAHGAEKIKTIGDAFMTATGLPEHCADHAVRMVALALAMQKAMADLPADHSLPRSIRIGISSGPLVAGVIGSRKFAYDIWGDTVNVAARMEQAASAGSVVVSPQTYERIRHAFRCAPLGTVAVKGKGKMPLYRVEEPRPA